MNELLKELEDDLRQQRLSELWKKVGPWLIGGSVAIVLGTAAGVAWKAHMQSVHGARTAQLADAVVEKDPAKSEAALDKLTKDHPGTPQAAAAMLQQASLLRADGKMEEALSLYAGVAADSAAPEEFRAVARAMAAHLAADAKKNTALPAPQQNDFSPLSLEADAWRLVAGGQKDQAAGMFRQLAEDINAPPDMRARAQEMAAYLAP